MAAADQPGSKDTRRKGVKDGDPSGAVAADFSKQEALSLKRAGKSYEAIARKMGVSKSTAWQWVNDGWEALCRENDEERRILRAIEEEKLDRIEKVAMNLAMAKNLCVEKMVGKQVVCEEAAMLKLAAIDRVLKVSKRRAELRGLNAPKEIKLDTSKQSIVPMEVLVERMKELEAQEARERSNRRNDGGTFPDEN